MSLYTDQSLESRVLNLASRVLPRFLSHTSGGACRVPDETIKIFLGNAFQRHSSIFPEIIAGCALSTIVDIQFTETTNWNTVKTILHEKFNALTRNEKYWNAYFRFFFDLTVTYTSSRFVQDLISSFFAWLPFDGSIRFDEDDYVKYFETIGRPMTREEVEQVFSQEIPFPIYSTPYFDHLIEQSNTSIYNLTRSLSTSSERGGPIELLEIVTRIYDYLDKHDSKFDIGALLVFYKVPDTKSDRIQLTVETLLNSILQDISEEKLSTSA